MTKTKPIPFVIPAGSRLSFVLDDGREIDLGRVIGQEEADRSMRNRARLERQQRWQRIQRLTRRRRVRTSGKIRRLYRLTWSGWYERSGQPIIRLDRSTWDDEQIRSLRETRLEILGAIQIPASEIDQDVARSMFSGQVHVGPEMENDCG